MLIRVPESWPHVVVAALAMVVLAALDLGGAYAAKEAVTRRSLPFAVAGALLFLLLFWVYASSLRYADLAPVTFGWVVFLQVGVLLLDRLQYGTPVSRGQWVAVGIVLAAQGYLVLGPAAPPPDVATVAADVLEPASQEMADAVAGVPQARSTRAWSTSAPTSEVPAPGTHPRDVRPTAGAATRDVHLPVDLPAYRTPSSASSRAPGAKSPSARAPSAKSPGVKSPGVKSPGAKSPGTGPRGALKVQGRGGPRHATTAHVPVHAASGRG